MYNAMDTVRSHGMQVEALVCICWKKLYYTVLLIGNCQLYCFQNTLFKVTDIFVDTFDNESHYFPAYGLMWRMCSL